MFFAVVRDKSSFISYVTAIKGEQKRIASIVLEKCELCLALDEGVNANQDLASYNRLKNGDLSVLSGFEFCSADTTVSVLLFTDDEKVYDEYVENNRIDDIVE